MRMRLVGLACLVLAGCANLQAVDGMGQAQTLAPPLQRFAAEGRISLRRGEQHDHMRFRWEHETDRDTVLLMSPLGQGLAELSRNAQQAQLTQANQEVIVADSLPQLAQRVFGTPLPLDALAEWLRGARPALRGEDQGWQVEIRETSAYRERLLVRLLEARQGDVELRLVVDDWDISE